MLMAVHGCGVCRLWGEIFQLAGSDVDSDDGQWMRLSDGVAPINVTCTTSTSTTTSTSSSSSSSSSRGRDATVESCVTLFHVAAYSRHVEKILDVTISQPGARLVRSPRLHVPACSLLLMDQEQKDSRD